MVRKFIEARDESRATVSLWGDGSPTREFLHVQDAAKAFCLALKRYDSPEPMNLGSGEEVSILDLASLIAGFVGYNGKIEWASDRPNGQPRRSLQIDRAKHLIDFRARLPLREGLRQVVDWYQNNFSEPTSRITAYHDQYGQTIS